MSKFSFVSFIILSCAAGSSSGKEPDVTTPQSWIEKSNALATEYALSDAERNPEGASALGFTQYDSLAVQLEDDMETRDRADLHHWKERLEKLLERKDEDSEVLIDARVLLKKIETAIRNIPIEDKYPGGMFCPVSRTVFSSLRELVNNQTNAERKRAAFERFKKYVRGHKQFKPYAEACRSRMAFREKKYGRSKIIRPLKQEVNQYLEESPQYLAGIKDLLKESGTKDWEAEFQEFERQVRVHDAFVKTKVLPSSRTTYLIPRELYVAMLRTRGMDSTPEELIRIGRADFEKEYVRFSELAKQVAKKFNLAQADPISVLNYLKNEQVTKTDEVKALYEESNQILSKILLDKNLVTLPNVPLKIRLAGDAESKAAPVPHLNPPLLIGNSGQRPEFVVPTASQGKLPFDDFSFRASALVMTAHEGRPGHDLQFSSMLDQGVSLIRARFAFNSVNVEGWGLYAEEIVFPYLPVEAQFAGLQTRLIRIARMFLDPEVLLGKANQKDVSTVLTGRLGLSKGLADLEFKRYAYDDPGQAPSYYFGLKKMLAIKSMLSTKLGSTFHEKCFHDSVLSLGLLPLDLIGEILNTRLQCHGGKWKLQPPT